MATIHERLTGHRMAILDAAMATVCVMIIAIAIIFPFINDPAKLAEGELTSKNPMRIEMIWHEDSVVDMDLWYRGPSGVSVGYNSREGKHAALLRDDLATNEDTADINYEVIYVRSLEPGEHVVNVEWYQHWDYKVDPEIEVHIIISYRVDQTGEKSGYRRIHDQHHKVRMGEEKNIVVFEVDENKEFVDASIHYEEGLSISRSQKDDIDNSYSGGQYPL